MKGSVFNYLALLAALVVGYGIFVSTTDPDAAAPDVRGVLQGYYLRNAVITETAATGAPHFRVAANEVAQNVQDNSVALRSLRIDYLNTDPRQSGPENSGKPGAAHWVLNADRGTAFNSFRQLTLQGNVQAHNLGAPRTIVFDTYSLDVDMATETARSHDVVDIGVDATRANGRGFFADLNHERFTLESKVGLRFAQVERAATSTPEVSLPDMWELDSLEYVNNVWTMTKVRSKTPPLIQANTLRATGADLANNKVVLTGAVRIELPKQGQLTADTATLFIRNNQVATAHVAGDTAEQLVEFQHRRKDSEQLVRGRANVIDYDVADSTLRLSGNAWFSDEQGEWSVDKLEYNIATEAVRGTRNIIKIYPRSKNPAPNRSDTVKDKSQ